MKTGVVPCRRCTDFRPTRTRQRDWASMDYCYCSEATLRDTRAWLLCTPRRRVASRVAARLPSQLPCACQRLGIRPRCAPVRRNPAVSPSRRRPEQHQRRRQPARTRAPWCRRRGSLPAAHTASPAGGRGYACPRNGREFRFRAKARRIDGAPRRRRRQVSQKARSGAVAGGVGRRAARLTRTLGRDRRGGLRDARRRRRG